MSGDGIGRLTQMLELNEFKLNSLLEIDLSETIWL